ncbi:kinesin heavy chain [Phycomyces nitens]|nr:kinesin heavy chain [Phycomyces nitens]
MSGNNIKVVCRFRPQNSIENREGGVPIIEIDDEGTAVHMKGKETQGSFAFDKVFGMNTPQKDVFDYSIRTIVDDVTAGYNGTVFAYGQTGSGKTFTMMGADIDNENTKGIIPRIVEQIFTSILGAPSNFEFTVKVSYMEIYMEKVRDLLAPTNDNLPIHEDKTKGVYVKGLLEVYVGSSDEVYEVMRRGSNNHMNAESSRSHSIVVVTITQKNLDTGAAKSGKLYLVDLAGSEKVGKTGASGQTLEEAKKINKSLTALGMVINALTDGKSSHVPYRDSKLTRILQESLGGNSRTTLIINCSPSSYNEAETLGTLRFGMRAKSIKNKAKVNADLSPAELKALLKKVKSDTVTFQTYIAALEGEVNIWRAGGIVPEDKWVTMEKIAKGDFKALPPTAGFKSPVGDDASRPATPAVVLEKDERDDFMKRENELMDQIAEKETALSVQEKLLESLREESKYYKDEGEAATKENQKMTAQLSNLKIEFQKISYDNKENAITVDSLKEANQDLVAELDELKKSLADVKLAQKDIGHGEKERKKAEMMAEMMFGFDASGEINEKKRQICDAIIKLDGDSSSSLSIEELVSLRHDLEDSKVLLEQHSKTIDSLTNDKEVLDKKKTELDLKFGTLEKEYEELLDKTIAEEEAQLQNNVELAETITSLKSKLELQYATKKETQQKEIDELKHELDRKNDHHQKLSTAMSDLKSANDQLQTALSGQPNKTPGREVSEREKEIERMRKIMASQLGEFETMKKALMRDLHARCEKVIELELSLEDTREQYNSVLKASNNRAQQKKMAFLERNLEQLTNVQKQLVEQNGSLKKEVASAERKLITRNERVQLLETLLGDAQEKLISQNDKFEGQLKAVRDRLEIARTQKSENTMPSSFARIVKPLRGRGIAVEDTESATSPVPERRGPWIPNLFNPR